MNFKTYSSIETYGKLLKEEVKHLEDHKIIQLFFNRSEQAIIETEKKYKNMLFSISFRILKNKMDAEECLNDVYLAAWETIPPQKPNPLAVYLARIVRNISINKYYKISATKRNSYYDVTLSELEDCFSDVESVEEKYEAKELASAISSFLDKIDKKSRLLFVRRYFFADSTEELARKFSLTENNVSVQLYRIRKKLKKYLGKRGYSI